VKPEPLIVTLTPGAPILGEMDVIVGACANANAKPKYNAKSVGSVFILSPLDWLLFDRIFLA
jgi:hypothetical protein